LAINTNHHQLSQYDLRLPPCDRFERPPRVTDLTTTVAIADGREIDLPTPFFWHDPSWHVVNLKLSAQIAHAIAGLGIVVSVLHREVSDQDGGDESAFFPRMATHRCDRAGWVFHDFENVAIIDLRMTPVRDSFGQFAYHPTLLSRWHQSESFEHSTASAMDAMTFPPDWQSLDDMKYKVEQLRKLSSAAVFVSFDATHRQTMLPAAISSGVDGVIISTKQNPAETIVAARDQIDQAPGDRPALWIQTETRLSAEDGVKCFALGANGLSVDSLCNDYLDQGDPCWDAIGRWIQTFKGYAHSCGVANVGELSRLHLNVIE
jgi:hypothetical protein